MVKRIEDNDMSQVKAAGKALVDFSATWCGPCKMLAPVVDALAEEVSDVEFFSVDVDECRDLAVEFGITNIPALILFENGEKKAMTVGFQSKEELLTFIGK